MWTLEKKGLKPSINVAWNDAEPTKTHMALLSLQRAGISTFLNLNTVYFSKLI